ncbi:MAG: hypothetical protein KDN05_11255 [Verrucomicrobiae bacterium]|nr:hypothetical protein [Verrucomicrobiae bacterium]
MGRRLRREFQALEALIEPGFQEKQWRALIDKVLHNKGPGPKSIVEQFRLRERLITLHARRDRYNLKRYGRRHEVFVRLILPQHVLAAVAIRNGIVESEISLRDRLIGLMVGDLRLSRKVLEELETIWELVDPSVDVREVNPLWIDLQLSGGPLARAERKEFEAALMPTPLPVQPPAAIPFGFPTSRNTPCDGKTQTSAARAAS